jgi:hypothetical protein
VRWPGESGWPGHVIGDFHQMGWELEGERKWGVQVWRVFFEFEMTADLLGKPLRR